MSGENGNGSYKSHLYRVEQELGRLNETVARLDERQINDREDTLEHRRVLRESLKSVAGMAKNNATRLGELDTRTKLTAFALLVLAGGSSVINYIR